MSYIVVIAFDHEDEASKVRESLSKGEKGGYIDLKDAAVIVRDQDGKLHIKNETSDGAKAGALWGGLIGVLAGFVFPVAWIAAGAIAGGLIGSSMGSNVDKKFVKEVSDQLKPGNSALFFIFRGEDVSCAIASLRPYQGTVLHTSLTDEQEKALRAELKKRGV